MEGCGDFLQWLGPDTSMNILMCLKDPSDLIRVCSVSSSWRRFVIENSLSKQLCLRLFPEISSFAHVIEVENTIEPIVVKPDKPMEWEYLKRDHRVYAFLARGLTSLCSLDA
ncbi:F-box protein At4g00755-like [Camellia sinensis]|uniref:F-box protein At4g00755-like n=1 Tax=Camellia sinensis TaxID=4442 RepID=UPI001035ACA7|nr:F-box protein At4g00755-like [Camellia sinensis]XP_028053945.1 F-box protein At4g00755-like [Camellia sinensis]